MLTCFWFVYVTLVMVTYTAGLVNDLYWASMVHVHRPADVTPRSLKDLVGRTDYRWGTLSYGPIWPYIMNEAVQEEVLIIKKHLTASADGADGSVANTYEGMKRALGGKYAFVTTSLRAKLMVNTQPCTLMTVGNSFGKISYGFALPLNSAITQSLNEALLEMKEDGDLEELEHKWFVQRGQCWNTTATDTAAKENPGSAYWSKPKKVTLKTMWGAFVLLLVGIILSVVVTALEMAYHKHKGSVSIKATMCISLAHCFPLHC